MKASGLRVAVQVIGSGSTKVVAEGFAEEIVTGLSRFSYLRVITQFDVGLTPTRKRAMMMNARRWRTLRDGRQPATVRDEFCASRSNSLIHRPRSSVG